MSKALIKLQQFSKTNNQMQVNHNPNVNQEMSQSYLQPFQTQYISKYCHPMKNCPKEQNETNSTIVYLKSIKQRIIKRQLQGTVKEIKTVTSVFNKQMGKNIQTFQIVAYCLNLICLLVHKHSKSKSLIQPLLSFKFVGNFLRLDLNLVVMLNHKIQSSLCLISQIISENGFFKKNGTHNLRQMFKQFCLNLLSKSSNNPKIIFHTLKLTSWLQDNDLLSHADYLNYDIVKLIMSKTQAFQAQNMSLYDQSFKLLINAKFVEDAYKLCNIMAKNKKNNAVTSFFTSMVKLNGELTFNILTQIIKNYIFQKSEYYSPAFLKMVSNQINKMSAFDFIVLIQNRFVDAIFQRLLSMVSTSYLAEQIQLIKILRKKSDGTIISDSLNDYFRISIQNLTKIINSYRGTNLNNQLQ